MRKLVASFPLILFASLAYAGPFQWILFGGSTFLSPAPPSPISTSDTITITNTSGSTETNRPISIPRPFAQGEIANFAQASINGAAVLTQCDVKNRWPDGSLKFAIVSFVVPSLANNATATVSFANQTTGNNTSPLTQSQMLAAGYNFDGQIQLTGTASHNISARAILTAAGSCNSAGTDPDGGKYACTYWLQGPIVTAVILEDRSGRSFDVNTDGGAGNPLHPIFEAWFYPQNDSVVLGYTLEDDWASTTAANSARDQTYSLVLTGGNTSPVTLTSASSFTQTTRTRWHRSYCINGTGAGNEWECGPAITVNLNWPYLATTKFTPNWDPALTISNSKITSEVNAFAGTNQGFAGVSTGDTGIGFYPTDFNATGTGEYHGPLTTWDIITLISQSPSMLPVTLGNADLGNGVPYFYREADTDAGEGQTFDNSGIAGNVQTEGRVVSINARTQVALSDVTAQTCNTKYPADWINFGGAGQDTSPWPTNATLWTSHWPNLAYTAYLMTGQYAYYEEQMMQSAYAVGMGPGSVACTQATANFNLRMGSAGYWWISQERGTDWQARENMIGAFIAVDGSPEQAYFTDKLKANIAVWEGIHNVPNDVGAAYNTAWTYGNTDRVTSLLAAGTPLGSWIHGPAAGTNGYAADFELCLGSPSTSLGCPSTPFANAPQYGNSNFQNDYSTVMLGWINAAGFCTGDCALLDYTGNFFINSVLNPAASMYDLGTYVYPTQDSSGNEITSWTTQASLYYQHATAWPTCASGSGFDEDYPSESISALSFMIHRTSSSGGYNGLTAYNNARNSYPCAGGYSTLSPKWDIVPRTTSSTDMLSPAAGWHKIPSTALCGGGSESNIAYTPPDNFPANLGSYTSYGFGFTSQCTNIYEDSNSGVYDTSRHRMLFWGGGHEHNRGNEVLSLELSQVNMTTPNMFLLDYPANPMTCATTGPANTTVTQTDGAVCKYDGTGALASIFGEPGCSYTSGCTPTVHTSPGAVHTYQGTDYIPGYDEMAIFGGVTVPNGNSTENVWLLNGSTVANSCAPHCDPGWSVVGGNAAANNTYTGVSVGMASAYDPNTQGVWIQSTHDFEWFNPANQTMTVESSTGIGYHSMAVVDPVDKYDIFIGCAPGACPSVSPAEGILYRNIACSNVPTCTGSNFALVTPATSGCANLIGSANANPQYMGVAWDPISKQVVIYPNGGNVIWLLNPKTWTCTTETYGTTQGTDYPQNTVMPSADAGTFGRFAYDPTFDVFVLCNDPNNDCWYLRRNR